MDDLSLFNQYPRACVCVEENNIVAVNVAAMSLLCINNPPTLPVALNKWFLDYQPLNHSQIVTCIAAEQDMSILIDPSICKNARQFLQISLPKKVSLQTNNEDIKDQKHFNKLLIKLHDAYTLFSESNSSDEFYQLVINYALEHLDIDRMGIILIDKEKNEINIPYGTSIKGEINHEDYSEPLPNLPWISKALTKKDSLTVWEDMDLTEYDQVVGRGWSMMAVLWDGDTAIGWLAMDNLINQLPLQNYQVDIIAMYAAHVSQHMIRITSDEKTQLLTQQLEQTVLEKRESIKENIELLKHQQKELIQTEKMAQLGGLVAGIAHEINTPIGSAVTAASFLKESTTLFNTKLSGNAIKTSDFKNYYDDLKQSTEIVSGCLVSASKLIKSFKKLAVEHNLDDVSTFNLKDLIDHLIITFTHQIKNKPIEITNNIDKDIAIKSYASLIVQIFTNFINNSMLHGWDNQSFLTISINSSAIENGQITIFYQDDGKGIKASMLDQIFDPFFTTNREGGGSGLGLNIVKNLVTQKLAGTIDVTSKINHGVTFKINMPAK